MFCFQFDTNLFQIPWTMISRLILNNIYTTIYYYIIFCHSIILLIHSGFYKRSVNCCSNWSIYNFVRVILLLFSLFNLNNTAPKMKFFVKYFFSKCDNIRRKLQIWSHLLEKFSMENFIFCAVQVGFILSFIFKTSLSFFTIIEWCWLARKDWVD